MDKINKKFKIKEPVRLRAKKLTNGNRSLYLDTYCKGKRSYEFLKLYLIPERTAADKAVNEAVLRAANAIKASRIIAIVHGKADIKIQRSETTISEWIELIIDKKRDLRSKSSTNLMKRVRKHLNIYKDGAKLKDADRLFCIGFADYLRGASALNSNKPLAASTQYELLNALSIILNEAVRADLIQKNPMCMLTANERIKNPESTREYLTPEEVRKITVISTDHIAAANDVAAFLFCCFCGLRYSDVVGLKWKNIIHTDDGMELTLTMKKTKRTITIPLSQQACSFMPSRGDAEKNVFKFPHYAVTLRRLRRVASEAGIKKKVTFHVSRHTFATMMLTAGADLYTISKLVGHTDVRTTQTYSKVVDKKKREAVALLDSLF